MSECQSLLNIASHFRKFSEEMSEDLCRMCLQKGNRNNFISLEFGQPSMKSKLAAFMPEMNLDIVEDPVICAHCSASLENAYQLKLKCLQTDGKIWSRIQSTHGYNPNLAPVKLCHLIEPHEIPPPREEITVEPNFNYYHQQPAYPSNIPNMLYQNLDVDKREAHSTTTNREEPNFLTCATCKETFESQEKLHEHIPRHFGQRPFMCTQCYKCFTLKSNLQIHLRTHTKDRPYPCDYCKKCFTTKGNLKTHIRVHTKEKPYTCNICQKAFIQKVQLNTHLLLHEDDHIFACNICKKNFSTKYTLQVHKRIHEDVKPFLCEHCDKCFTTNGNLGVHMRKHTGEKPYKCDECEKCFSQSGQLKLHVKKNHNLDVDVISNDGQSCLGDGIL